MMFERFTKRARTAVEAAQRIAAESGAESVRPEHLMLAMLEDEDSLAARVMSAQGAPPEEVLALKHNHIDTEHIVLGLARGGDPAVTAALTDLGVGHSELRRAIVEALRQAG